ncbi:nuclear transport factor 2 family protein [Agarivorans sp. Z349TD_8]|uniref:nuclear transport factor 2 family protein n=1 Tax=Agarivorans sp. Z349TD_8 TaxID=3421434 RepID=UPI003D7CB374
MTSAQTHHFVAPKQVVRSFWEAMRTNDFYVAAAWLAEDFEGFWPQSAERIVGRNNFAEINQQYPAEGRWTFQVNSLLAEGNQVVSDVSISDGVLHARAITFHTVKDGLVAKQVEYWPEDFPAPEWRAQWVELNQA